MENNIEKLAKEWMTASLDVAIKQSDYYCQTRDVFEARNDKVPNLLMKKGMTEDLAYLIYSMIGELGNNAYDHNLGSWPSITGIFFAIEYDGVKGVVVIADRGLGILSTLRNALPNLATDEEAAEIAFTRKISGRILENRGNGLKFVKNNVRSSDFFMRFYSGNAVVSLNHEMKIEHSDKAINGCLINLYFGRGK